MGLALLESHSTNYGDNRAQHLALPWWNWPKRHWDTLGCSGSMNFMGLPLTMLTENQPINGEEVAIAEEFVDALIGLGALLDHVEHDVDIIHNFLLFLVPKPG